MWLSDGAPIRTSSDSVHNHRPDFQRKNFVPSEVLPGIRPNSTMYHDGRGYYYIFSYHTKNAWYLRCLEPQCRVRAHMEPVEGSPIIQSPNTLHNHCPDFKRKQFVLWMEQAKHRAVTEELPIPTICAQEAARDPQSANMITQKNMNSRLYKARKALANKDSSELEAAGEEGNEAAGNKDTEVMVADSEYDQDQDSDAVFTIQAEGSQDSNTVYLYQSDNSPQQRPTYVDDKGFCYEQTTVRYRMRYLKCLIKDCKADAYLELGKGIAPIVQSNFTRHNHGPDLSRKQIMVFLHRVKRRAAEEDTPMYVIYQQEAERDPQSASQIRMENVKQRMMRFCKKRRQDKVMNQELRTFRHPFRHRLQSWMRKSLFITSSLEMRSQS